MATLKIENDQIRDRGDAQEFMREVIREIGRGYSKGPGWEFEDGTPLKERPVEKPKSDALKCGGCDAIAKNGEGEEVVLHRKECDKYDPNAKRPKKEGETGTEPWNKHGSEAGSVV